MKVLAAALILVLASLAAGEEVLASRPTVEDYHQRIGIPLATKIRESEEDADKAGLSGQRIVGGEVINISEIPHQVGLLIRILFIFTSTCGGSLISPTRIVTAAHCHNTPGITAQRFTAVLGSNRLYTGGVRIDTNDISVHPEWDYSTIANDIAVLRIPAVTYTNVIQPIALPSAAEVSKDLVGVTAHATGFGLTSDGGSIGLLQRISSVFIEIVPNAICAAVYGDDYVRESNICTSGEGGQGTCQGDSGGPLTVPSERRGRILVGVTSYGASAGCAAGYPAAFARITSYQSWILAQ